MILCNILMTSIGYVHEFLRDNAKLKYNECKVCKTRTQMTCIKCGSCWTCHNA